jgi:hypothetical protein
MEAGAPHPRASPQSLPLIPGAAATPPGVLRSVTFSSSRSCLRERLLDITNDHDPAPAEHTGRAVDTRRRARSRNCFGCRRSADCGCAPVAVTACPQLTGSVRAAAPPGWPRSSGTIRKPRRRGCDGLDNSRPRAPKGARNERDMRSMRAGSPSCLPRSGFRTAVPVRALHRSAQARAPGAGLEDLADRAGENRGFPLVAGLVAGSTQPSTSGTPGTTRERHGSPHTGSFVVHEPGRHPIEPRHKARLSQRQHRAGLAAARQDLSQDREAAAPRCLGCLLS